MSDAPPQATGADCYCGHPLVWSDRMQVCAVYGLHRTRHRWGVTGIVPVLTIFTDDPYTERKETA